jgi:signal transduction histidine kinase
MSIRVRLALWYAGLTSAVVAILVASAYVVHNRESYEDVDRSLMNAAEHYSPQIAASAPDGSGLSPTLQDSTVLVRLYGQEGAVLDASPDVSAPPPLDVRETLEQDAGPLYDRFIRWLPGGENFEGGGFATARDPATGARVRLYALPVEGEAGVTGYVQTWAPIGSLDGSMRTFRYLMLGLALAGVAAVWLGSFLIAGRALQPISTMIHTARAIALSRGFSRRLAAPSRRDELGELALTFNEMVTSLEDAYRSQQRFIADAAHELRAPLTAIQGNIELLSRLPDMPEHERAEALWYIDAEARRLSRIVGELLTLARADAGQALERHPLDLDRVLLEVLVDLRPMTERHRIELVRLDPVVIDGDRDRLKQLLFNLLDNSLKYTPIDGSIAVSLERTPAEAVLEVRDAGIGISEAALPHVFERFFRADPSRGRDPAGTGLGLAISKWIVDQHEGSIAIESAPERGTSVTVRLPALNDALLGSAGLPPAGVRPQPLSASEPG